MNTLTNDPNLNKDRAVVILRATLELVAEYGLHGTTIAMIGKTAEASPGIIYHYFASKDEIVQTLYRLVHQEFMGYFGAAKPFEQGFPQRYLLLWLNSYTYFIGHPKSTSFLEQYKHSAYGQAAFDLAGDPAMAKLNEQMQTDIAQGLLRDLPFEVLYILLVGTALGIAQQVIHGNLHLMPAQLNQVAEACCRTCFR